MDTATKTGIDSAKNASDLCDYSDAYIVVKGDITVEGENNRVEKKTDLWHLKIMHHLFLASQNKRCINIKYRRLTYCNANVQFARVQQKLFKDIWFCVELL